MLLKAALILFAFILYAPPSGAAESDAVRIGVLTDMSGSMAAAAGLGSVEAAQLAVEDMGGSVGKKPVIVINADFQNRSDLAQHISESWINKQGVDVVVDIPSGPIAGKLHDFFKEKNKLLLTSCPSPARFRDDSCRSTSLSWLYDRDTLTLNLIQALIDEKKKRWFIINSAEGYSRDLLKITKKRIKDSGGELVGEAQFGKRMNGLDMILDQAIAVKPDIVFLAFDRPDLLHLLAHWPYEKYETLAPLAFSTLFISDVYDLAKKNIPAFYTIAPFYWNQDNATRDWSKKFAARNRGAMPTDIQASVYSSVRHYLQSVKNSGMENIPELITRMKNSALNDPLFGASHIRKDGFITHRLHLLSYIKERDRSKPWDIYKIVRTTAPQDVMVPAEVDCVGN